MATLREIIAKIITNDKVLAWGIDKWAYEFESAEKMKVSKKYPEGVKCGTIKMAIPIDIQPLDKNCIHCVEEYAIFLVAVPRGEMRRALKEMKGE